MSVRRLIMLFSVKQPIIFLTGGSAQLSANE
jgi:hypothetical protein